MRLAIAFQFAARPICYSAPCGRACPCRSPHRYFHARHWNVQNQRSAGDLKPRASHSRAGGFLKVVAKGHVPKRRCVAA